MISQEEKTALNSRLRSMTRLSVIRSAALVVVVSCVCLVVTRSKYVELRDIREQQRLVDDMLISAQLNTSAESSTTVEVATDYAASSLLQWFSSTTSDAGCQLAGLEPSESEQDVSLRYSSWRLDVTGSYHCVGRLTESLEQSGNVVEITSVDISTIRKSQALLGRIALNVWVVQ